MRIFILGNFGMGLYNFRRELIEELIKQKHEVYISLPKDEYVDKMVKIGCKFIDTPINRRGKNPISDFKLLMHYSKYIKKVKPDVVLTYTIKPNIYGGIACMLSKTPYITNITGLGTAVENKGILQKITLSLYKLSLRKANRVFFQNEDNKNFFTKNNIIDKNYKILPGSGVNLNYYSLLEYPKNNANTNFLFISRVMKEKGIDQFLEAAIYIKENYPNTEFHVVGFCEEDYEERLNKLHRDGIIHFHGKQSDIRKLLEISHCTIHPSYYPEGMSNVLLESASCGRPIITTNRSGCREIVEDNYNGYLIEPKDTKELIKKIEAFLELNEHEKRMMGLNSRKKVEREFNRDIVVDNYIDAINQSFLSRLSNQ